MTDQMNALLKYQAAPGFAMRRVDTPTPGSKEVLVKVTATSICGTDLHLYEWDDWARNRIRPPLIIGHEFAGEVVELGPDVKSLQRGDYVSGESHIVCGVCRQCRTGNAHICANLRLRGIDTNGCFAEYTILQEDDAWKNDPSIPKEVASAQEPLGNAVHAVFDGEVAGQKVAIFGCGPIGACAAALCTAAGASEVIAVDIVDYRLNMAKAMGAKRLINGREKDPVKEIAEMTQGEGVDVFLEMSGSPVALKQGLKVLRPGGRASLLGLARSSIEIDVANDIVMKGLKVNGIVGRRMFDTWYKMRTFLTTGAVDLSRIITHRFEMKDFEEPFELMKSGQCGKIILYP